MLKRVFSTVMFILLLTSMLTLAFNIQPVKASGTIYIRADGSIDPPTAPISTVDNVTYTLVGDINDSIVIERGNITVDGAGYTLQGSGDGIGFDWSGINNVTIEHTSIKNFYYGIYLGGSSGNIISGNNITNNNDSGICLGSSSGSSISGNNITKNYWHGIYLYYSSGNSISGNTITSIWDFNSGIFFDSSSGNIIFGNTLTENWWGIYLSGSSGNSIFGNNITANHQFGIYLDMSSSNNISGNNITNNHDYGIWLYYSSNDSISGNKFIDNGLFVSDSYQTSVENNTVNGKPLVYLEEMSDYTVDDAGQVVLVGCDNIRVEGLNLSRTTVGVELWETSNCTISGNNITANYECGIYLYSSSNNSIFHNNFINNAQGQVYSLDSICVWDDGYPSGGNYWSDYSGTDLYYGPGQNMTGSDGIGDTPPVIGDNFPLMNPYVSFEDQTIYIRADGSVDPSGAPIQRSGDVYTLTDNITSNADGIVIEKDNIVFDGAGNTLQGTSGAGISLLDRGNVTIKETKFKGFDCGITSRYSNGMRDQVCDNRIHNNIFSNNYWGIAIMGVNYTIYGNKATDNTYGIGLLDVYNSTINGNNLDNNTEGIRLFTVAGNNTIYDNVFAGNYLGVDFEDAYGNEFYQNNVVDNTIGLSAGSFPVVDNFIYHNNFINNTVQIRDIVQSPPPNIYFQNTWDDGYPSGGNYWSDYNGTDLLLGSVQNETGSDGIGDTPYVIDANNRDNYPLMKPYGGLPDIEISYAATSKNGCLPMQTVGQGYCMNVTAIILNYGEQSETFNVTVYADTTAINQTQVTVTSRNSTTITFTINSTSLAYGNYTISVYAWPVLNETHTADNNLTAGIVKVTIPGDINGNFIVNILDAILLSNAYLATPGSSNWNPNADINNDGVVNILDAIILSNHYNQHYP